MSAIRQQRSGRGAVAARGLLVALLLLAAPRHLPAANDTWTNYSAGWLSDYRTNSASWNPAAIPVSGDTVYLTNSVNLAYTNILNITPGFSLSGSALGGLIVSNSLGEAWLDINNNANLIAGPLTIGTGGRVLVETGSTLQILGATGLKFFGTNGVLYINNGATMDMRSGYSTAPGALDVISGVSGVTGMIASLNGPGGVWKFEGGSLNFFSGSATNNQLTLSAITVSLPYEGTKILGIGVNANASANTLILSNYAKFFQLNSADQVAIG